jgi:hypothetical protein
MLKLWANCSRTRPLQSVGRWAERSRGPKNSISALGSVRLANKEVWGRSRLSFAEQCVRIERMWRSWFAAASSPCVAGSNELFMDFVLVDDGLDDVGLSDKANTVRLGFCAFSCVVLALSRALSTGLALAASDASIA